MKDALGDVGERDASSGWEESVLMKLVRSVEKLLVESEVHDAFWSSVEDSLAERKFGT